MVPIATRRERVVLELEDKFSAGVLKAALATELLDQKLNHLSGEAVESNKATRNISKNNDDLAKSSNRAGKEIDQFSGRLRVLADVAAIIGPSLVPIGAVAVPGITGLASSFGFAAVAAGTAVVAFQGVGDALKAVNKAQLEPTSDNLNAARTALEGLSPAAAGFVGQIHTMMPQLKALRDTAAEGLFPGVTAGLDALEGAFPRVQHIFEAISTELGNIAQETGESLASEHWAPFLDFVATEGPSALSQLAEAVGNTAHAFAGLWMSTTPLNRDFSQWLVDATADLDEWANKLGQTQGFQEFVQYIETNGPKVAETFAAIGNAAVQILEAVAPLGGPALAGIKAVADSISTIANSPLGTPIFGALAGLALLNRSMAAYDALQKATFGGAAVQRIAASDVAMSRFGATTARTTTALGALKGGGLAAIAAILGIKAAHDALEKSDPSRPIADFTEALSGLALGAQGADGALDAAFKSDNTGWARLTNGKVSIDGLDDAFKALGQNDFSKLADFAQSGLGAFDTAADLASKSVARADTALAQMVTDGNLDGAQTGFTRLSDSATRAGLSTKEIAERFPEYTAAVAAATGPTGEWASRLSSATSQADNFAAALTRAQNVLTGRAAEVDYAASLDAMSESLKKNGKTLDITTEKGRANRTALDGIANGALNLADKIQNPALKAAFLDNARHQFIKSAEAAGMSSKEARKLATDVGLLNSVKGTAKVNVTGIAAAITGVKALDDLIAQLHGKTINIKVNKSTNATVADHGADGTTVPKTGKPYADRHPYMLADGEEVISNRHGQADKHRGLLKAINSGRALASGGTVDPYGSVDTSSVGAGSSTSASSGSKSSSSSSKPAKKPKKDVDHLTKEELKSALDSLVDGLRSSMGLAPTGPAAEIRAQFRSFADQIKQDGGKVGQGFHRFEEQLVRSAVALDRQRTKVEDATKAVDDLKQAQAGLRDVIKQAFTTDIFAKGFGQTDSPTVDTSGLTPEQLKAFGGEIAKQNVALAAQNKIDNQQSGLRQVLQDAKDAQTFADDLKALKKRGLKGTALSDLANSANLDQANTLLGLTNAQLRQYTAAFAARDAAVNGAAASSANTVMGDQLIQLKKYAARQNELLRAQITATNNVLTDAKSHGLAVDFGKEAGKAFGGAIKTGKGR
ncbi:MAG: hypothetical protein JWP74_1769 [Marmoricola sp.]|nr:hypothetical protein [Marmoricola sp.]